MSEPLRMFGLPVSCAMCGATMSEDDETVEVPARRTPSPYAHLCEPNVVTRVHAVCAAALEAS